MTVQPPTTTTTPTAPPSGPDAAAIAKKTAIGIGLVAVWSVQYLLWVPVVFCWRLFVTALRICTKLGILGILLICIPIIGWIILVMIWNGRRNRAQAERHHQNAMAALGHGPADQPGRSLWTPWGIGLLRS